MMYIMSIGYGYKPIRALFFSFSIISVFAFLYIISDYWNKLMLLPKLIYEGNIRQVLAKFYDVYLEKWYLSGAAYTTSGFGNVSPESFGSRILSIVESLLGVSVVSLFVYSLTKKYGEKK